VENDGCPLCASPPAKSETEAEVVQVEVEVEVTPWGKKRWGKRTARTIWTWERYQFLGLQKAKLGMGDRESKYFDKGQREVLARMCSERFQIEITADAITGALNRLRDNPNLATPPDGVDPHNPLLAPMDFRR
jgi:hypothetical protein